MTAATTALACRVTVCVCSWVQSGGEASLVAQVAHVNDTEQTKTIRNPPVITVNKGAVFALYALNYIRVKPFARSCSLLMTTLLF